MNSKLRSSGESISCLRLAVGSFEYNKVKRHIIGTAIHEANADRSSSTTMATATNEGIGVAMTDEERRAEWLTSRLSIPFPLRLPLSLVLAGCGGFGLGVYHGSQTNGLRFRAENAHRFPTSQTGWYLYHKSKNYNMALGGVVEGLKMSLRFGLWTGLYVGMEEFVDRGRGGMVRLWRRFRGLDVDSKLVMSRDVFSSILAGFGTAGVFSAWERHDVYTAARMARLGAKGGLVFGLLQDALSVVRGRKLGYVEFVKRHTFGSAGEDEEVKHHQANAAAGSYHLPAEFTGESVRSGIRPQQFLVKPTYDSTARASRRNEGICYSSPQATNTSLTESELTLLCTKCSVFDSEA
nr:hypothetical protein CFP56_70404 [Quercus suber]